jgi:hypothetical protein
MKAPLNGDQRPQRRSHVEHNKGDSPPLNKSISMMSLHIHEPPRM